MIQKIERTENSSAASSECQPSRKSVQIRVTSKLEDFADWWPRTDRLGAGLCYAFQCADILDIWRDTIGAARKIQTLFVAVLGEGERPQLLLPLGIERRHHMRVLTFLDDGVSDYNAPVVFPGAPELDFERIWQDLMRLLPPFDVAIFEKMPDDICGVLNPLMKLRVTNYSMSGHVTVLSGTWAEFAAHRLPRQRDTRRKRRRLAKLGSVVFAVAETHADYDKMFASMIRQKTRRYLETMGVDEFDRLGRRCYYTEATHRLAGQRTVHLSALKVDDQIVATHWGLVVDNRFYSLLPAYEGGEWSRYSPGRLLIENLIEWSFANRVEFFDFGVGDEKYKAEFQAHTLSLYRCILPVTMAGHIYATVYEAANRTRLAMRNTKVGAMLKRLRIAVRLMRRKYRDKATTRSTNG